MTREIIQYALIGTLALALVAAAVTDWRRRIIENWLTGGIALAAPLFWFASGLDLWPGMAIQLGAGVLVFAVFAIMFAFGAMGGGDVKLLGALALWLPVDAFIALVVAMSIIGGVLTVGMMIRHSMQKALGRPEIPYGVAISAAGLWSIYERYLNHFA